MHKLVSKYVRLTPLDCNDNRFDRSRKINKHCFELIKNKEKRFYKAFAIFDEEKIIKSRQSLFYLKEDRDNLFVC